MFSRLLQVKMNSATPNPPSDNTLFRFDLQALTWERSPISVTPATTSSSSSDTNSWLQLDLGADKTLCNIGIAFPNGNETVNFFKVQTSTDAKVFADVGDVESYPFLAGGQLFTFPDMPDKARCIRISDIGSIIPEETKISEVMAAGR